MKKEKTPQYLAEAELDPMATDKEEPIAPEPSAPSLIQEPAATPQIAPAQAAAPIPQTAPAPTLTQPEAPQIAEPEAHPPIKVPTAHEYGQEDMNHMHDAATRQITPKTYESMFAEKSTMGKIGTLFGLMLSGAGSGLAHQSNAVLDMMNNVIKNDLDGQKTNVTNAQNFLTMAYQHELQQAQIRNQDVNAALAKTQMGIAPAQIKASEAATEKTKKETELVPLDAELKKAETLAQKASIKAQNAQTQFSQTQTEAARIAMQKAQSEADIAALKLRTVKIALDKQAGIGPETIPAGGSSSPKFANPWDMEQAKIAAPYRAENAMRTAVVQHLTDASANNPQATQMIQTQLIPAVAAANEKNNADLEMSLQSHAQKQMAPYADPVTDRNAMNQMISNGRMFGDDPLMMGSVPSIPSSQVGTLNQEISQLKANRRLYADWIKTSKELAQLENAGQISPGYDIATGSLGSLGTLVGAITGAAMTGGIGAPVAAGIGGAGGNAAGKLAGGSISAYKEYLERQRTTLLKNLQQELGPDVANSIVPSRADEKGFQKAWEKGNEIFAARDAQLGENLNQYGLKTPFPMQEFQAPRQKPKVENPMVEKLRKNQGMNW